MPDANLHKYLKEIKNYLTCPEEEKRKFLEELESSIDEFLADHPHATEADLVHRFGDPAGIAQSFLQEEDFKEVQEKIRLKGDPNPVGCDPCSDSRSSDSGRYFCH